MQAITFRHLGLVCVAVRLSEALDVLDGSAETILDLLEDREVGASLKLGLGACHARAQQ